MITKRLRKTTINVSEEIHEKLKFLSRCGESYDDVLKRVLASVKEIVAE